VKVLVTGAAGFIGSHVAEQLVSRGDEVVIVDSFDPFYDPAVKRRNITSLLASGKAELVEADIRDREQLDQMLGDQRIDGIIHLAARAGVRPSLERPGAYVRTNVEGTQSLLDIARQRGIRPFVFGSSSSVYGDSTPVPFKESASADQPISPYAATKRAAELLCRTHAYLYGSSMVCLRLFTVYGPRQRPDLAIHKFARLMLRNEEIPLFGDGSTERDYTFVADAVDGIVRGLDWCLRAPPGAFEVVNIGEHATTSLASLVEMIATELRVIPRIRSLPAQPGDVQRTYADISHARELLGYDPQTTMEEGIHRFWQWLREQPAS